MDVYKQVICKKMKLKSLIFIWQIFPIKPKVSVTSFYDYYKCIKNVYNLSCYFHLYQNKKMPLKWQDRYHYAKCIKY